MLIIVGFYISQCAIADWVEMPMDSEDRLYVNESSLQSSATNAQLTWIIDLQKPSWTKFKGSRREGFSYSSKKFVGEYNCSNPSFRILHLSFYSGPLGKGSEYEDQQSDAGSKWLELSYGHQEWKITWAIACGKK